MGRKKKDKSIATVPETPPEKPTPSEKPKPQWQCGRCISEGVEEAAATFFNFGEYGLHLRDHKRVDRGQPPLGASIIQEGPTAGTPNDITPIAEPDEMVYLRKTLMKAGVLTRLDSIVDAFSSHSDLDDLPYLDKLMNDSGASTFAKKMALTNWADHRRIDQEYIYRRYPSKDRIIMPMTAEQQAVEAKVQKDPFDSMTEMMEKQMKLQMLQEQMSRLRADNDSLQMQNMMKQRMLQAGVMFGADGKPFGTSEKTEEAKLRAVEGGQFVKMTEAEYADYLMRQQQFGLQKEKMEQDTKIRLAQDEKKKESEKIPLRLEDGTIINVPSDQVDKYLFMLKSTAPDQKKDLYELMREQEKTRQEMEKNYQSQAQQMRDQMNQMLLDKQETMIRQLQTQMASRPNPIQEMVHTQEELKSAGLLAEGSKDIEQHQMAIQEKKLDTTMNLILQQQAAMIQKTNMVLNAIGPIVQQYAQKAAANLPEPGSGKLRANLRDRRKQMAQEVMPLPEQDLQAMQQQLESELQEDTSAPPAPPPEAIAPPKPRAKKTLAVGRQEAT